MLYHLRTYEEVDEKGTLWTVSADPNEPTNWIPDPCERCSAESVGNICEGDGRYHHHGRVHTIDGEMLPLCSTCALLEAVRWEDRRSAHTG